MHHNAYLCYKLVEKIIVKFLTCWLELEIFSLKSELIEKNSFLEKIKVSEPMLQELHKSEIPLFQLETNLHYYRTGLIWLKVKSGSAQEIYISVVKSLNLQREIKMVYYGIHSTSVWVSHS